MISLVSVQMTDRICRADERQSKHTCAVEARNNFLVATSKTPLASLRQFQQHFDQTLTPFPQRESAMVLSECALIWLAPTLGAVGGGEQQHAKFTNYHPDRIINELQSLISIIFLLAFCFKWNKLNFSPVSHNILLQQSKQEPLHH